MDKNNKGVLSQFYNQLVTEFDQESGVMWCYMNPHPRPCFTPQLLNDLNRFLHVVKNTISSELAIEGRSKVRYIVFGSHKPGVFSLGGDLRLFLDCINSSDKKRLSEYMRLSIEVMYNIYTNMDMPITTISMIRGNALGAGFEGALSCDYIVAEKTVQLGFPEVLFNMFPGMGAYSFLARRLDSARVEKMILSGRIYNAEELYEMGLIHLLSESGDCKDDVMNFIRKIDKTSNTRNAVLKVRNRINPVRFQEMMDVGEIWVDAALSLTPKELKVMERLVRSQDKMAKSLVNPLEEKVNVNA
ncbi:MAG: crotonase/enoyl-CoA hydratase family protein [Pseudomonadota bacterium]